MGKTFSFENLPIKLILKIILLYANWEVGLCCLKLAGSEEASDVSALVDQSHYEVSVVASV